MKDERRATNVGCVVAQHIGESLAFAETNFLPSDPEDQEVLEYAYIIAFSLLAWYISKSIFRNTPAELGVCFILPNYKVQTLILCQGSGA